MSPESGKVVVGVALVQVASRHDGEMMPGRLENPGTIDQ